MGESAVNHPSHYAEGRVYEPIRVINAWDLGFDLGNSLKYVSRLGRKDPTKVVEDLNKALFYINDEIERIGAGNSVFHFYRHEPSNPSPNDVVNDWNPSKEIGEFIVLLFEARSSHGRNEYVSNLEKARDVLKEYVDGFVNA